MIYFIFNTKYTLRLFYMIHFIFNTKYTLRLFYMIHFMILINNPTIKAHFANFLLLSTQYYTFNILLHIITRLSYYN